MASILSNGLLFFAYSVKRNGEGPSEISDYVRKEMFYALARDFRPAC